MGHKSRGIYKTTGCNMQHARECERDAEAYAGKACVKLGEIVVRPWRHTDMTDRNIKYKTGVVIYIHPRGYYHVVKFRTKSGVWVTEAFSGTKQ